MARAASLSRPGRSRGLARRDCGSLVRDDDLGRARQAFGQGLDLGTDLELERLLASADDEAGDPEFRAARRELVAEDDLCGEPPAVDVRDGGLTPPRLAGDERLDEHDRPPLDIHPPGELLSHPDRRSWLRAFDHEARPPGLCATRRRRGDGAAAGDWG